MPRMRRSGDGRSVMVIGEKSHGSNCEGGEKGTLRWINNVISIYD
jgi:hypothetical protein